MNSALKPVLASAGVPQPAGQSSPAKGNVASVNHASVGHPQGAQNSLNHATNSNNLAVQNLTQHVPAPQVPPHAVPSMAPVSANMAQMAQNMSNHGNLSHVNQSSCPPAPAVVASPSKAPSTSSPLSLVAEKPQPLALTRSPEKPEKKEPDSTGQSNGTVDSPKSASNTPVTLKAQNTEANKDKIDIAKTSPSTTKPPEKPALPSTPQKPESANPATQADVPTQSKAATASEPSEKSPAKPVEPKPAPTADIAPTQSDSKPVPESASNSEPSPPEKETAPAPAKVDPPVENAKTEPVKAEEKEEEASEKPPSTEEKPKEAEVKEKPEPKKEDTVDAPVKVVEKEKVELKKVEPKKEPKPKSTLKLATVTPPLRKRRQVSPAKGDGVSPAKKAVEGENTPDARTKRNRTKVQLYQSPTPELAMATKLSASAGRSTPTKPNDDKLIVFYKNEYLAVRNAEGGFYVCQAMQNVYRTTRKIKIRWLSQDKTADPSGETYKPDFYDVTDMDCVLTTLSLSRAAGGGGSQLLKAAEQARATSILQRALKAESSPGSLQLTPEHPDGLDLSLYTDESQLEQRARKRAASKAEPGKGHAAGAAEAKKEAASPAKKARTTPKRSPKSARKAKPAPPKPNNNKRKPAGSAPVVASTSKTATAVIEKAKAAAKATPKRTPPVRQAKPEPVVTPLRKGRRAAAKEAPTPIAQPSTSTGKSTRTPRKPPTRK